MRHQVLLPLTLSLLLFAGSAFADRRPLDCANRSLANAVSRASNQTILFTGICSGPIVIRSDGVNLVGVGAAVIDGRGRDAVTVAGANRASLVNTEVRNGTSGILAINGAHLSLTDVNVHDNEVFGISLQTASSAILSNVTTSGNGFNGLDVESGSTAKIRGVFTSSDNGVFGVNVNGGSALTFARANATVSGNTLGVQVATGANAFLADPSTVLNVVDNRSTGLTIVSGAHVVSFGSAINASGNPVNGVSLNSKAGLDLDAGAVLDCDNNGNGLFVQADSEVTVFNIPQFSGFEGFSAVECDNNAGTGVIVRNASNLRVSNRARVISTENGAGGLIADDGAGVILVNSDITNNSGNDIELTFGTRADVQTSTFTTVRCDETVLVRGASGITCPQ